MKYKDMKRSELKLEIETLINSTNFTDTDKAMFLQLIEVWGEK